MSDNSRNPRNPRNQRNRRRAAIRDANRAAREVPEIILPPPQFEFGVPRDSGQVANEIFDLRQGQLRLGITGDEPVGEIMQQHGDPNNLGGNSTFRPIPNRRVSARTDLSDLQTTFSQEITN